MLLGENTAVLRSAAAAVNLPQRSCGRRQTAAAALGWPVLGQLGEASLPRLRWLVARCRWLAGLRFRLSSRGCAANGQF